MLGNRIGKALVTCAMVAGMGAPAVSAQGDLMIYPKQGQSPQQQQQDRYNCHIWAVQQSGFDPSSPSAQASSGGGGAALKEGVRGGARGAAAGAAIGAIAGGAGKGAAIGAIAGAMGRTFRERDRQMQTPASPPGRDNYNRAMASCLEALGYSVK